MAIEAPLSKYKKSNLKIFMAVLIGAAVWFGYDGYYNGKFIEENTTSEGVANDTLKFNRKAPPFLFGGAVLLGVYLFSIRNKKIVANDQSLVAGNKTIDYDKIEAIDKTHFDKKGFFIVMYKDALGSDAQLKLSDRTYDRLPAVLDELIARIT